MAGSRVGMAAYRGIGADDQNVARAGAVLRFVDPGIDDAQDGQRRRRPDLVQGQGAGGVAGDDQEFRPLVDQKTGAAEGIARDRRLGFRSVREPRGIPQIEIVERWEALQQGPQYREAAEAGIEDSYFRPCCIHRCFVPGDSEAR